MPLLLTTMPASCQRSEPTIPNEVGFYDLSFAYGYVNSIVVTGDYAYVAAGPAGLRIIDISVPSYPHEVGSYITPGITRWMSR